MNLFAARRCTAALFATALLAAAPARAGYIGHQVQADYLWPSASEVFISSGSGVANAGVEFSNIAGWSGVDVDFSDTGIRLTYNLGWGLSGVGSFDGWAFSDLDGSEIAGVALGGTNLPGLTGAMLSFSGNQVFLNTLGLGGWSPGTFVSIDVVFADVATVPEPGAPGLAGLALLLLAAARSPRARTGRPAGHLR